MKAPGVGCGAAIWRDGRLLLLQRRKAPQAGAWSLPGGKVDEGERVADAVRREIAEELDVEIALGRSLGIVEILEEGHHWVSPVYEATIRAGEPRNVEPEKHAGLMWADPASPPSPLSVDARLALQARRTGGA